MPTKHHLRSAKPTLLSRIVLVVAIAEPLSTLPQLYDIWVRQNTAGVSAYTWVSFSLAAVIWLMYGLQIKNRALIISSALWVGLESAVVIGLLLY